MTYHAVTYLHYQTTNHIHPTCITNWTSHIITPHDVITHHRKLGKNNFYRLFTLQSVKSLLVISVSFLFSFKHDIIEGFDNQLTSISKFTSIQNKKCTIHVT